MNSAPDEPEKPAQNSEPCPICDGDGFVINPATDKSMRCDRCDGKGEVAGTPIDLTRDYKVPLPCGCIIVFVGATGHRKSRSSVNSTCTRRHDAKHAQESHERARRIRCTKMERIE